MMISSPISTEKLMVIFSFAATDVVKSKLEDFQN